jgi:NAD(P)-dependent dehydrogenase (short-subunit alcohol dehydrogenase family)
MEKEVCLITGVGPGTGSALVKQFSKRYQVAMIARNEARLNTLTETVANTHAYPCDVSDASLLSETLNRISDEMATPSVVIHNAVGATLGGVLDLKPEHLERNFRINTTALLRMIQHCAPAMVEAGRGAIVGTGNTAAYRGKEGFSGFAPTKAAQRILLESTARELGPKGIHAAYIAIDAAIDLEWTRAALPDAPDEFFCKPSDIAEECFHLVHQPRSAWTFDVVIRPFGENW